MLCDGRYAHCACRHRDRSFSYATLRSPAHFRNLRARGDARLRGLRWWRLRGRCEPDGPIASAAHSRNQVSGRGPGSGELRSTLVKSLESDDSAERFYAIEGLKRLTGDDLGYIYYADESARRPAVNRWKDWLNDQRNAANGE